MPVLSRRSLLQLGSLGLTGVTLPRVLGAESTLRPTRAKACLLVYLDGGASHIDLLDLKPAAPDAIRGPWQPIHTSAPGIDIGELLPRVAQQMHHALLVRSIRHEETVHDPAVYQMLTGYKHLSSAGGLKVEDTDLPHLSSAWSAADRSPMAMPKAIQLPETMKMEGRVLPGQNGGILGATFDPFLVEVTPEGDVLPPEFERSHDLAIPRILQRETLWRRLDRELSPFERPAIADRLNGFQHQALDILRQPAIQQAFDLNQESPTTHDRYGRDRHGQSVLLARRLIEAGSRFVTVYWGREQQDWADGKGLRYANNPWDTHRNHFPILRDSLTPRADRTLAALLDDLHQRGMLEDTLVLWLGDFGRTPRISRPWNSRDHWPDAFSIILAGGGVKRGEVYGATDRFAEQVTDSPVSPADLTATIIAALGIDPAMRVGTANGRMHQLSTGRVMREWFASTV